VDSPRTAGLEPSDPPAVVGGGVVGGSVVAVGTADVTDGTGDVAPLVGLWVQAVSAEIVAIPTRANAINLGVHRDMRGIGRVFPQLE